MNERKHLPLIKKQGNGRQEKNEMEKRGIDSDTGPHVGSSDAFLQTENTASQDADNISDEKLDEWVDEK